MLKSTCRARAYALRSQVKPPMTASPEAIKVAEPRLNSSSKHCSSPQQSTGQGHRTQSIPPSHHNLLPSFSAAASIMPKLGKKRAYENDDDDSGQEHAKPVKKTKATAAPAQASSSSGAGKDGDGNHYWEVSCPSAVSRRICNEGAPAHLVDTAVIQTSSDRLKVQEDGPGQHPRVLRGRRRAPARKEGMFAPL